VLGNCGTYYESERCLGTGVGPRMSVEQPGQLT